MFLLSSWIPGLKFPLYTLLHHMHLQAFLLKLRTKVCQVLNFCTIKRSLKNISCKNKWQFPVTGSNSSILIQDLFMHCKCQLNNAAANVFMH